MNGKIEVESSRPRPQSAGIWTLFSWLRRSDHSSSESISSVGSDRTAASFDFLAPLQYRLNNPPLILPSSPPTDTYKKRLHERNVRRLRDRDLSIHRKYGLLRVDDARYDTFNLTTCSNKSDYYPSQGIRDRRAASECIHRRAAYVPGKRRAPQPPLPVLAVTLPRSNKRKRPAPKPPCVINENNKENFEINPLLRMSNKTFIDPQSRSKRSTSFVQKTGLRDEPEQSKEKSFLKQIFVNKKRNSAIDTSHVKLLPSISELDKQALEIIERKKSLKANELNWNPMSNSKLSSDNVWICTGCLRRYSARVTSCLHCSSWEKNTKRLSMDVATIETQTDAGPSFTKINCDDREKLKEMLKEMKKSLPKRTKHEKLTETSTLRIGANITQTTKEHDMLLKSHTPSNDSVRVHSDKDLESISKIATEKEKFFNSQPPFFNIPSNNTHIQPIKPIVSTNILINKQKIDEKNNDIYDKANGKHSEILHNDKSSLKNEKGKIISKKNNLQEETNTHCSTNLPFDIKFSNQKLASNKTRPNPQRNQPNSDDNKKKYSDFNNQKENAPAENCNNINTDKQNSSQNTLVTESDNTSSNLKRNDPLNSPLKISSLLNPLYCPKRDFNEQKPTEKALVPSTSPKPGCSKFTEILRSFPAESNFHSTGITNGKQNDKSQTSFKQDALLPTSSTGSEKAIDKLNSYSQGRILISQLEQSLFNGDEKTAADVAGKLAKLKLSCSVLSHSSQIIADMSKNIDNLSNRRPDIIKDIGKIGNQNDISKTKPVSFSTRENCKKVENPNDNNKYRKDKTQEGLSAAGNENEKVMPIEVWIEDKETTRGPIRLYAPRNSTMKDLMQQVETSLGLAIQLQRWIVGRTLCTDNNVPLSTLAGPDLASPFYLCLVKSDDQKQKSTVVVKNNSYHQKEEHMNIKKDNTDSVFNELIELEKEALIPNREPFECEVCMENRAIGEGIVLRECLHIFCRECLTDAVRHCEQPIVSCPEVNCSGTLQEREVRALLSFEEYETWLARSLTAAECGTRNTFHCRTRDCKGWAFCEPGVKKFPCPVCKCINCIECQANHEGVTCKQYQEKLQKSASVDDSNLTDEGTKAFLNSLISRGEALECPECRAIITKKWGCDWVKCSACKTEICWVTKGRRWGPAGRGDTSAGCRCGVDGQRCHPSCGYCH